MKNLFKMMAYAAIVIASVFVAMSICSCDNKMDLEEVCVPAPQDTTSKTDPKPQTPTPTPKDTTKVDPYAWANIMAKELHIDENRQVESKIIAQRNNGEKDSTILRYILGFEMSAPDTVRLTQPGTERTVYIGTLSFPGKDYTPTTVANCDSAIVVTTTKGYKTNYYNVTWKTSHVDGWILFKGHMEPYKNSEETTSYKSLSLYKDAYEIVRNDSIYLREEVKNIINMAFHRQTFSFEKKVVVDHFIKMKEQEQEEEEVEEEEKEEKIDWDYDVEGLGRMVSLTINIRPDTNSPYVCAHFEGGKGHTFIVDNYDKDGKYTGHTEKHFLSYSIAEKSNDYNGVGFIQGKFYPGYIEYKIDKKAGKCAWVITCRAKGIEDGAPQQSVDGGYANTCGLKNFYENNSAYTTPFIKNNTSTSKEVNGKMVWYVSGKTSEKRELVQHTIIDSSLK